MIVYDLACDNGHKFEGWFGSVADCDGQLAERRVLCPLCGSGSVAKLPTASHVNTHAHGRERPSDAPAASSPPQYANVASEVLTRLIDYVMKNTEDVGAAFPEQARKIHYGEAPERRIRGTAAADEVKELKEEGIDVLPLPGHLFSKRH